MAGIFAGEGLGLFNGSLAQLNGFGAQGNARVGNGNDRAWINAANGNLVIQSQDDYLAALGLDVVATRTYNSQGLFDGDNGDNWQLSFYRRLLNLPVGAGTSDITRINGDGHRAVFSYDNAAGRWISTDGAGAHDVIFKVGAEWVYEEGTSGRRETFDADGKIIKESNRDGHGLAFSYSGDLIATITAFDAGGVSGVGATLVYSGSQLQEVSTTYADDSAVRVRYAYDASGRLTEVRVDLATPDDLTPDAPPQTYVTAYEYSGTSNRVVRVTQSDGSELLLGYVKVGDHHRVASLQQRVVDDAGIGSFRTTFFNYDIDARRTDVIDGNGAVSSYFYDVGDRLVAIEMPQVESGFRERLEYAYDASDNITSVRARVGIDEIRESFFQFDSRGNRIASRDSLGNTREWTYDARNNVTSDTAYLSPDPDAAGPGEPGAPLTTNYVYDDESHLRFVISADGRVEETQYFADGHASDGLAQTRIRYTGALYGGATRTLSDLEAWAAGLADQTQAERTDYTYDLLGQLASSTRYVALQASGAGVIAGRAITRYVYSAAGELLMRVDARNTGASPQPGAAGVTSFVYDGLGRVISSQDSAGRLTTVAYDDAANRIVTVSDAVGAQYRLETVQVLNRAGEIVHVTEKAPTGEVLGDTSYFYDANGQLRLTRDGTGAETHYLYDGAGRQVGVINPLGELTERVFNGAGQVIRTIQYSGRVEMEQLVDGAGDPLPLTLGEVRGPRSDLRTPVVDLNGAAAGIHFSTQYVQASAPVAIFAPALAISDADSSELQRVTVSLSGLVDEHYETLSVDGALAGSLGITVSQALTGSVLTLTFSGVASPAQYQDLLKTITYRNTAVSPTGGIRAIYVTANDGVLSSQTAISTLDVIEGHNPPQLDANENVVGVDHVVVMPSGSSVVIGGELRIEDDSATLVSAEAYIVNAAGLAERLSISTAGTGITATYSGNVMRLSGAASVADYQAVLRTLTYERTLLGLLMLTNRVVEVKVNDGTFESNVATIEVLRRNQALPPQDPNPPAEPPAESLLDGNIGQPTIRPVGLEGGAPSLLVDNPALRREAGYVYDQSGRLRFEVSDRSVAIDTLNPGVQARERAVVQYDYDGASRLVKTTHYAETLGLEVGLTAAELEAALDGPGYRDNPLNRSTRAFYDGDGTRTGSLDAEGYLTTWAHDGGGRVVAEVRYATATLEALRDAGTLAALVPQADIESDQVSRSIYNARGELTGVIDPLGNFERYEYDADGNQLSVYRYAQAVVFAQAKSIADYIAEATPGPGSFSAQAWITRSEYDRLNRRTRESRIAVIDGVEVLLKRTNYQYDPTTGFLTRITEGAELGASATENRAQSFGYDGLGRLLGERNGAASASAGRPNTATHSYDVAGRRISTTDANGRKHHYFYNAGGQLRFTVSMAGDGVSGEVSELRYNTFGNVIESIRYAEAISISGLVGGVDTSLVEQRITLSANDRAFQYSYTLAGEVQNVTDAEGDVSESAYNSFGDLIASQREVIRVSGLGSDLVVDTWQYDRRGLNTGSTRDLGGQSISQAVEFDAFGRATQKLDAMGRQWQTAYDRAGRVVTATDPLQQSATTTFDAFDRILSTTNKLGDTTTYQYDDGVAGRSIVRMTTPEGVVTTTTYDRYGSTIAITRVNNGVTEVQSFEYNKNGQLTRAIDAEGNATQNIYNQFDQLSESRDEEQNRTTYSYDAASRRLTRTVDPGGGSSRLNLVTQYEFDAFGQAIAVVDARGIRTETVFDAAGHRVAVIVDTNGLREATVYTNDTEGRVLEVREGVEASPSSMGGGWDFSGPELKVTQYTYDAIGRRVAEVVDPDGLALETKYRYDDNGNMVLKVDARGSDWRYVYDELNRKVYEIDPGNGVRGAVKRIQYDAEGRVTRQTSLGQYLLLAALNGSQTSSPVNEKVAVDSLAQQIENEAADRHTDFVYDGDGRERFIVDSLGYVNQQLYDANGRLVSRTEYATPLAAAVARDVAAIESAISQPGFSKLSTDRTTIFAYDLAGRLASQTDAEGRVEYYSYDGVGNRTALTNKKGDTWNYVYDAANRLIEEIAPEVTVATSNDRAAFAGAESMGENGLRWGQDFRSNSDGLSISGQVQRTDGVLRFNGNQTATVTRTEYRGTDTLTRVDVTVGVGVLQIVLEASGGQYAGVLLSGAGISVRGHNTSNRYLGPLEVGATYSIEIVSAPGGNQIYVYRAGDSREDGFIHKTASYTDSARLKISGYQGFYGGETHSVNAISEYRISPLVDNYTDGDGLIGRYYNNSTPNPGLALTRVDSILDMNWGTGSPPGVNANNFRVEWTGAIVVREDGFYAFTVGADDGFALTVDGEVVAERRIAQSYYEENGGIELKAGKRYEFKLDYFEISGNARVAVYIEGPNMPKQIVPSSMLRQSEIPPPLPWIVGGVAGVGTELVSLVKQYQYDKVGNLIKITEAAGRSDERVTVYEYDGAGRQVKIKIPNSAIYDAGSGSSLGRKDRADLSATVEKQVLFDALGRAVAQVDEGGAVSRKVYDEAGRLRFEIDGEGYVSRYERNSNGDVISLRRYAQAIELSGSGAVSSQQVEMMLVETAEDRTISSVHDLAGREIRTEYSEGEYYDSALAASSFFNAAPVIERTYDAFGQVIKQSALQNPITSAWHEQYFYYDRLGRTVAQIDPMGFLTEWEYNDRDSAQVRTEYAAALQAGTWGENGYGVPGVSNGQVIYTGSAQFAPVTIDFPYRAHNGSVLGDQRYNADRIQEVRFDRLGQEVERIERNADVVTAEVQANGAIALNRSAQDLVTTIGYDAVGNVVSMMTPGGRVTYTYYDKLGRVSAVVEPGVRKDPFNALSGEHLPLTIYLRDEFGSVIRETRRYNGATYADATAYLAGSANGANDQHIDNVYDNRGLLIAQTDGNGHSSYFSYDAYGRVAKQWTPFVDALGRDKNKAVEYHYDDAGRIVAERHLRDDGGDVVSQVAYNAFGEITAKGIGGLGDGWQESYRYDNNGRLLYSRDRDGQESIHAYDLNGWRTAEYRSASYHLEGMSLATAEQLSTDATYSDVRKTRNVYDALGRVVRREAPRFQVGNASNDTLVWQTPVTTQMFDRWGNLTRLVDAAGKDQFFYYNKRNQLIRHDGINTPTATEHDVHGTYQFRRAYTFSGYDADGNLAATVDPRGFINAAAYTGRGLMLAQYKADRGQSFYEYDAFSRVERKIDGADAASASVNAAEKQWVEYQYDKSDQIIRQADRGGSERQYRYDALGNRISERTLIRSFEPINPVNVLDRTQRYATAHMIYDGMGRLTAERNSSGITKWYAYNDRGDRISTLDENGRSLTWAFNEYGWSTSYWDLSGREFYYLSDKQGRIVEYASVLTDANREKLIYSYDSAGQLRSVTDRGAIPGALQQSSEYRYDIRGLRVQEKELLVESGENGPVTRALRNARMTYHDDGSLAHLRHDHDYGVVRNPGLDQYYYYDVAGNKKHVLTTYKDMFGRSKADDSFFRYDALNRVTVNEGQRPNTVIDIGNGKGVQLSYDSLGNRVAEVSLQNNQLSVRSFEYGSRGELKVERKDGVQQYRYEYDSAGRRTLQLDLTNNGGLSSYIHLSYNDDGRVNYQRHFDSNLQPVHWQNYNFVDSYDSAGNLLRYDAVRSPGSREQRFRYSIEYDLDDVYQKEYEYINKTLLSSGGFSYTSRSEYEYTANGHLKSVESDPGSDGKRWMTVDHRGQILYLRRGGEYGYEPTAFAYANDQYVASVSTDTADVNPLYQSISTEFPKANPTSYVTAEGDTLGRVAALVYGDSRLWYLIGDANAVDLDPGAFLSVGQTLTIPSRNTSVFNSADSFKPYDPSEIVGNTSPELPPPPAPSRGKCGVFSQLIVIVVAVVATVVTYGAATTLIGPTLFGSSALAAGAAAGVGAAVGSIAGQGAAIAAGLQEDFSWSAVGRAAGIGALTAGIGEGLGLVGVEAGSDLSLAGLNFSGVAADVVRTTIHGALNQGLSLAMGEQESFSWGALAGGAAAAGLMPYTSNYLGRPASQTGPFSWAQVATDTAAYAGRALIREVVSVSVERNGKVDVSGVLGDGFGNALGNSLVGSFRFAGLPEDVQALSPRAIATYEAARSNGVTVEESIMLARQTDGIGLAQLDRGGITTYPLPEPFGPALGEPMPLPDQSAELGSMPEVLPRGLLEAGIDRGISNFKLGALTFFAERGAELNAYRQQGGLIGALSTVGYHGVGFASTSAELGLPEDLFDLTVGLVFGALKPLGGILQGSAIPERGVRLFSEQDVRFFIGAEPQLGPTKGAFFMPLEDAAIVRSSSDALRYTGQSPSILDDYKPGKDIFGLSFPTKGLPVRVPTVDDAEGWKHYLEGGYTAVRLPEPNGGYLLNPTRELFVPGAQSVPQGSVLFKLGPNGEWIPLKHY